VLEEHGYTDFLKSFSKDRPRPRAIVLFSAHWESLTQTVSAVPDTYETIYDFGGFQDELYRMTYPARGDAALSEEIGRLLKERGIESIVNVDRGLDHGAWAVGAGDQGRKAVLLHRSYQYGTLSLSCWKFE